MCAGNHHLLNEKMVIVQVFLLTINNNNYTRVNDTVIEYGFVHLVIASFQKMNTGFIINQYN